MLFLLSFLLLERLCWCRCVCVSLSFLVSFFVFYIKTTRKLILILMKKPYKVLHYVYVRPTQLTVDVVVVSTSITKYTGFCFNRCCCCFCCYARSTEHRAPAKKKEKRTNEEFLLKRTQHTHTHIGTNERTNFVNEQTTD